MYTPSEKDQNQIQRSFTYHAPKENQVPRYEMFRAAARDLAGKFVTNAPASRELSLALTKLEEAVMWANAAIARNE